MKTLGRDSWNRLLALADQGVASGTTFVSAAVVARSTRPDQYGAYALVLSGLFVAVNLQGAAVTTPFNYRRHSLPPAEQRRYAGSVIISQLIFGLLVAIGFCAAAIAVTSRGGSAPMFPPILYAAGMAGGAYLLRECCRQLSFAHERVASALRLDVATSIIQFGGLAALHWRGVFTASHALMVLGAATAFPAAVWLIANRDSFHVTPSLLGADMLTSLKAGRWLIAGVVAHFAAKDLYPWLLEATRNVQTVALFAAASGVALLINPAVVGIGNTLSAAYAREVAERGEPGLRSRVRRDTRLAALCMLGYVVVLAVAGRWLSVTIYGSQYSMSGTLITLIAISLAASVVTLPIGLGLFALDRTHTTFTAVCVAIAVSVIAGIPLATRFGAIGVGVALCLSNSAESLVKTVLYRNQGALPAAVPPVPEELCASR
jgi:O-antigen/teichoic acid export membrane protein